MKEDIEKYLKGQLGPEEMHALEMKALSDPFLFDALGGAESIGANDFLAAVRELDQRIAGKQKRKYPQPVVWRIAASVALLIGASYAIYTFIQPKDETLAQQQEEASNSGNESSAPPANGTAADSLLSLQENSKEKLLSLNRAVTPQPAGDASGETKEEAKPFSEPAKPLTIPSETEAASGVLAEKADDLDKAGPDQIATTEQGLSDRKKDVDGRLGDQSSTGLATHVIKGKVTDAGGAPVPGANVIVQGTSQGTVSDVNGNFQLITDSPGDHLAISFIGYQTKEIKIPSDPSQVNVQLQADASALSEVIVTGYGARTGEAEADEPMDLAAPADGRRAYNKYLESNLHYPPEAVERKIEGRVTLEFAVQADGTLSDFSVVHGLESGCNEEVIRLVREGPRWKPSSKAGTPVKSTVRVSVKFKLPE